MRSNVGLFVFETPILFRRYGMETRERNRLGLQLLNACYFGNFQMAVTTLQEPNCPVDWCDSRDGWTALHYAARWGHVPLLRVLLNAGANVNIKTQERETPLHKACRSNKIPACAYLMSRGADPHALNVGGDRPSALTGEEEIRKICDHYEAYCLTVAQSKSKVA